MSGALVSLGRIIVDLVHELESATSQKTYGVVSGSKIQTTVRADIVLPFEGRHHSACLVEVSDTGSHV